MLPDPLHPAVVHFPVVLSVLLPVAIVAALLAARRPSLGRAPWLVVVALSAGLAGASWLAVETGEREEERVEDVVGETAVERHADRAEGFLAASAVTAVIAALGLLAGRAGQAARGLALAGSLLLLVAGYRVGHSGGELVYRHGAAQAYLGAGGEGLTAVAPDREGRPAADRRRDDDDDDRR
ncbi:MAG: DUF2231 domain-containing protein [Gemmatimonadales bacterium]